MIADRTLKPGQPLTLRPLAQRLGMSVSPVRDALVMLHHQRVLRRGANRGFRVMRMTPERIRGYFALREALLVQSGRMAAERITDPEIDALRDLGDRLDRLIKEHRMPEVRVLERRFHLEVAEAARCEELQEEIVRLGLSGVFFPPVLDYQRGRSHRCLADLIAARDPDAVERETRLHIASGLADALNGLEHHQEPAPLAAPQAERR